MNAVVLSATNIPPIDRIRGLKVRTRDYGQCTLDRPECLSLIALISRGIPANKGAGFGLQLDDSIPLGKDSSDF